MKILNIVGARPNFMKVSPVHRALVQAGHDAQLIHTGQHYDEKMSEVFFDQLGMPKPHRNLDVGSASHAVQTARIMEAFEPLVLEHRPDLVLVAGDVNSTVACALVATKLHVKVAHLEAGLRSRDRAMPEEINRILTDQMSDLLLTPSPDGDENLLAEGIPRERIALVGNVMIDTLLEHVERARALPTLSEMGVEPGAYGLITLHRPSNVDHRETLSGLLRSLKTICEKLPLVWAVHPRTRKRLEEFELWDTVKNTAGFRLVEPLGYLEFLALQAGAKLVLTDSGGIQEETTALGVPCLTLRENTERPITVDQGTNTLVGVDPARIVAVAMETLDGGGKSGRVPPLWDGQTAARVVKAIEALGASVSA